MTDEIDREQRSMGMQRSPIRLCCFAANQATTPPPDGSWMDPLLSSLQAPNKSGMSTHHTWD